MGDVGRLAQPLRLARRQRVSDLGLPQAVPAARPRRDAARRGAARRSRARRRHRRRARAATTRTSSSSCTSGSCSPPSRASRSPLRSSALYLWQERRLKRRATTILRRPAPSLATLDRLARAHRRCLAAGADARHRRRPRAALARRRAYRRARRRDARHLGSCGPRTSCCARRAAGAAAAPRTSRSPASRSSIVVRLALPATHFA